MESFKAPDWFPLLISHGIDLSWKQFKNKTGKPKPTGNWSNIVSLRHGRKSFPQGRSGEGNWSPPPYVGGWSTLGDQFLWEINSLPPPNPGGTGTHQCALCDFTDPVLGETNSWFQLLSVPSIHCSQSTQVRLRWTCCTEGWLDVLLLVPVNAKVNSKGDAEQSQKSAMHVFEQHTRNLADNPETWSADQRTTYAWRNQSLVHESAKRSAAAEAKMLRGTPHEDCMQWIGGKILDQNQNRGTSLKLHRFPEALALRVANGCQRTAQQKRSRDTLISTVHVWELHGNGNVDPEMSMPPE